MMAYRRRQGFNRASTFKEESYRPPPPPDDFDKDSNSTCNSQSLAAQAIRAHRYSASDSSFHYSFNDRSKAAASPTFDDTSNQVGSFWGVLARKAKSILNEDMVPNQSHATDLVHDDQQLHQSRQASDGSKTMENPTFRKGMDALSSSLNQLGDTIGNALEEGRTIVESKTADIRQETRKLQIGKRENNSDEQNQVPGVDNSWQQSRMQPLMQTSQENQLKASRDLAVATAAKAKLLLRELKTVKADLAFAKQRSSQLEEENRILREGRDKGDNPADDDMIRLQLETLLAEKARLAHENSMYARENRFLREIVEYHQLTEQDVVYLDEGSEEVTEVQHRPLTAASRTLSTASLTSEGGSPSPSFSPSTPINAHQLMSAPSESQSS